MAWWWLFVVVLKVEIAVIGINDAEFRGEFVVLLECDGDGIVFLGGERLVRAFNVCLDGWG